MSRGKWAVVLAACIVLAAVAAAYAAGQAKVSAPEVIRAQKFELVDEKGKVRAELTLVDGIPGLLLSDQEGKPRAALGLDKNGTPSLSLHDSSGKTRAALSFMRPGGTAPTLAMFDERGKQRVQLGIVENGSPGLSLCDEKESVRVGLAVTSEGSAVGVYRSDGKPAAGLEALTDGDAGVSVYDKSGRPRGELGVLSDGSPSLKLRDEKGSALLAVDKDGPMLGLFDKDAKVLWKVP